MEDKDVKYILIFLVVIFSVLMITGGVIEYTKTKEEKILKNYKSCLSKVLPLFTDVSREHEEVVNEICKPILETLNEEVNND